MSSLLTGIVSGVGTAAKGVGSIVGGIGKTSGFQSVLGGLRDVGGGFKEGIGQSLGQDWTKTPKTSMSPEMVKNIAMRGAGGAYRDFPTSSTSTPSIWNRIGKSLGTSAMESKQGASSTFLPSADTSTSVQRGRGGYQGKEKKSRMESLLEQLARR